MPDEIFAASSSLPARVLPDGAIVAFNLRGDGGGAWVLCAEEGEVTVVRGERDEFDCRSTCSVEDFRALLSGDLDGKDGFLQGRLAIEGDVGLVLGLHQALHR